MKKSTLKKTCVIFSVTIIFFGTFYTYIQYKNSSTKENLLNIANNVINENIVRDVQNNFIEQEEFSMDELQENNNIIGKIIIPSIGVEAPIKDGTTGDVLKVAVGHFSNTSYWNGNICLASHNRGTYAHYFEKINELSVNDEIIYQTKLGTRVFLVKNINKISENDLSVLDSTEKNCITLITCVKGQPELRLCLKAVEKI